MKRALALVLAVALMILSYGATATIRPPQGFEGDVWSSTFALFGTKDDVTHFLCTTEIIKKELVIPTQDAVPLHWDYELLSAGHCVQLMPTALQFSVAENIDAPRTNVTMVKAHYDEDGLDFSVFDFVSTKDYPVMELGNDEDVAVGDAIVSSNFSLGLPKQLSHGFVASLEINPNGYFIVQAFGAPGASGSAILSAKTHKIIGILVIGLDESATVGYGVEPISAFQKFLAAPVQPHPAAPKSDDEV